MSRQEKITQNLHHLLQPIYMEVINESYKHRVPEGAQTHFKVIAVSNAFDSLKPIQRHQLIYKNLAEEFNSGLHALSLELYTQEEWEERKGRVHETPPCQHKI